ncbi:hypothetical protein GIB67_022380 [Kingdonia uniflora]|uniref:Prephenate/arogenate dehydrogenase domain-containing protein n=1 Tax=Kingdonia uniflora TaxID=39325 RepID=A0A7J7MU46_9MAGN|nr:hypothetical protein GIB67_022380 [Kingdonia uniflora]
MATTSLRLCHCNSSRTCVNSLLNLSPAVSFTNTFTTLCGYTNSKLSKLSLKSIPVRPSYICNHAKLPDSFVSLEHALEEPLKVGIIGFGNFGQFIAKAHEVLATSRSDYSEYCQQHGIKYFRKMDALCEEQPDLLLVCSSILSTEAVVRGIPMHKLKPDTIFADVLSVKQFPRNLFLEVLPAEFGIVCTHPMVGPESGKNRWAGLPFVYDKVRIAKNSVQDRKCAQFLSIFEQEVNTIFISRGQKSDKNIDFPYLGCRMVEMLCEEHDCHAAGSQFITHTIGRILSHLDLESTPINTKGYETLLQLTENTVSDSFDLYYGLFMYNVNASEQIENLDRAFETVKQKLFGRLHDILRKQLVERVPLQGTPSKTQYFLPSSEKITDLSFFAVTHSQENNAGAITHPNTETQVQSRESVVAL